MQDRTDFRENATVTFADGSTLELTEDDFTLGDNKYTDAAGADSLPLGVAIARTVQMELYNGDDRLASYNFVGARIRLYITFPLSDSVEKIELGTFTVISPETYGETVTITAADDMYRADKPYTTQLAYPVTLGQMYREICDSCGIPFETAQFRNSDLAIAAPPEGDYTYRQMLGYVSMLAVGNARINRQGYMQIIEYDKALLTDSGFVGHNLADWISLKTDTENATITGVSVGTGGYDEEPATSGNEGYVLSVSNPLMEAQACADLLGAVLVGMTWRKFGGDIPANPTIEFMDAVKITDRKGNTCYSVVTDLDFTFFTATSLSNSAESALRNQQTYTMPDNATQQAKKLVGEERTAREAAMEQMADSIAKASGMHITSETQPDGSTIYYLHDKPTLAESQNVVKITAEAFGFSTDGGLTYPFGWTVTGDMIAKILAVEGINADWINAGTMSAQRITVNGNTLSDFFDVSIVDGHPVVRLGASGSQIVLKQYNDRIAFYDTQGTLLAYWNNDSFEIVTLRRFRLGNLAAVVQPNGSVSLVRA